MSKEKPQEQESPTEKKPHELGKAAKDAIKEVVDKVGHTLTEKEAKKLIEEIIEADEADPET